MVICIALTLRPAQKRRFSIPDRFAHLLSHTRRHARCRLRRLALVAAGRYADQLLKTRAERAQQRAAHLEADLGDAELSTASKAIARSTRRVIK